MNVTKNQIRNGIVRYLDNDVVRAIGDKPVMMAAAVIAGMLKGNDGIIDRLLNHPVIGILLCPNDDGTYNIDGMFDAIQSVIDTYGNFEVKLPLLKSPFVFNAEDFNKLKRYIEEV